WGEDVCSSYLDETGDPHDIDMTGIVKNLETLTTIVANADGTFTYNAEDGLPTTIDIADLETLTTLALAGDDVNITYTDENGDPHDIDMTGIVKNLETLTTIVANADGTFTYNAEDGLPTTIDIADLETLTTLALAGDDVNITYTDENGDPHDIDMTGIVKNLETLTTIVANADGTFPYPYAALFRSTIDIADLETLTTL